MKRTILLVVSATILVVIAFLAGRLYQDLRNGYHLSVIEQKQYGMRLGPIQWSYVHEDAGAEGFLDSGTTILAFHDRTIYKAKRIFQEDFPFARNVVTSDNSVTWEDGEYRFQLTIAATNKTRHDVPQATAGALSN
jgi:hypothetical protein